MSRVAIVGLLAACSSPHQTSGDAGVIGHLSFETKCAPTSLLTFDSTPPGETAMAIAFAINDSDSDVTFESDLTPIGGPDAADFAMSTDIRDACGDPVYVSWQSGFMCCPNRALPPHAWCELAFEFHPSTLGSKQATYTLGSGAGTLTLSGEAGAAQTTFHADRVNVATSYIATYQVLHAVFPPVVSFKLINDSAQTVDVGTLVIDPMYTATDDCPASLTPGGACNAQVSLVLDAFDDPPKVPDCRTTTLTSSTSTLSVPITYAPPPAPIFTSFAVAPIGDGGGEITSSPAGIDCVVGSQAGCSEALWSPPATLQLTATPAAGSEFVGWFSFGDTGLLSCGTNQTCSRPLPTPSLFQETGDQIEAWFVPATYPHVHITIVGTGDVAAVGLAHAATSWTFAVASGQSITLAVSTGGTFVGWSGDCTGTGNCQLGSVINDRNVTATFNP